MRISIEGHDLPGRDIPDGPGFAGQTNIHIGLQRRGQSGELLDRQPGDAGTVTWSFECTVNGTDLRGPYIQGNPGGRFIYLNWGALAGDEFALFRRAKLMLDGVPSDVLAEAIEAGRLTGTLGLTDAKGLPVCASVRPPRITWSAT